MAGSARRMLTNARPLPLSVYIGAVPRYGVLATLTAVCGRWQERARSRRELARLSEHDLCDIGMSCDAVAREIAKPFWRG